MTVSGYRENDAELTQHAVLRWQEKQSRSRTALPFIGSRSLSLEPQLVMIRHLSPDVQIPRPNGRLCIGLHGGLHSS
jgi:hypothetical protein